MPSGRRAKPVSDKAGSLSPELRQALAKRVIERLSRLETFDGHRLSLSDHILRQARQLSAYLRGEISQYKPFSGTW